MFAMNRLRLLSIPMAILAGCAACAWPAPSRNLQIESRLKGLDAVEVFLVTIPREFAASPNVPSAVDLRAIVDHRLAADKIPTVSFFAVAQDEVKLEAYQAKKKAHLIVDVQLVRSGDAFAYNVLVQLVEDAKVNRTSAAILAPIWSKAAIGVASSLRLKAAVRNQIVDFIDTLAEDFARSAGG
jgi:hypothetical protein